MTKSGAATISAGDIFTCNIGTWLYTNESAFPITCEWVTTSGIYRGNTLAITPEMLTISFYTVRVGLRVNSGSPVTGAWTTWWVRSGGGYESRSDYEFFAKTYAR